MVTAVTGTSIALDPAPAASPIALATFARGSVAEDLVPAAGSALEAAGLRVVHTQNRRAEKDTEGGRYEDWGMEHGKVAAVNLHVAGQAAAFVSLYESSWTTLQRELLVAPNVPHSTIKVRCKGSISPLSIHFNSKSQALPSDVQRAMQSLPGCSVRDAYGRGFAGGSPNVSSPAV